MSQSGSSSDKQFADLSNSVKTSTDPPRMIRKFGDYGKNPGCFKYPCGIAATKENDVIVTDNRVANSLQMFNDGGDLLMATQCIGAADVAVLPNSDIAVACYSAASWLRNTPGVRIYDSNGVMKAQLNGVTSAAGICINSRGEILVTDQTDLCVTVLSSDGKVLRRFGGKGSSSESFRCPVGICTNSRDEVLVADMKKHRLFHFDRHGRFLRTIEDKGKSRFFSSSPGTLLAPERICCDRENRIYVTDNKNGQILVLSDSGEPKQHFGLKQSGKDSKLKPIAVDITVDNYLLTACVGCSTAEIRTYLLD